MSLRTKTGFIFAAISVMYLVVVPFLNPDSPHQYEAVFVIIGIVGLAILYIGRNDPETRSP